MAQVMRRLVREATITAQMARSGSRGLIEVRLTRYPHFVFLPDVWRLRNNLSAYDAVYVVLAERLVLALITRDARLASAAREVTVEVF